MTSDAPGWDAIDRAVFQLHAGQEPIHFGTILSHRAGGPDPLDGVNAFKVLSPVCHWHVIGYGLTELYDKESDDPALSGWGLELTLRVACDPDAEQPPEWAVHLLQNLARAIYATGHVFAPGETLSARGPIVTEEPTALSALVFLPDPQLPEGDSPHGRFSFLQVIGITHDERLALLSWSQTAFAELLMSVHPLGVTDLARPSLLSDPVQAERIRLGCERDGSTHDELLVRSLECRDDGFVIGAAAVEELRRVLPGRVPFGRPLRLISSQGEVTFEPDSTCGLATTNDRMTIRITSTAARALAAQLEPRRGDYTVPDMPSLLVRVVPTEITDRQGHVVEVIG